MIHPTITALLARLLNTLPAWPWLTRWAPRPVIEAALSQLQHSEHLAIEAARHRLQIRQLQEQIEALQRELEP